MKRRKNIWFWTATVFGILIVFLLTIVMVVPWLLDRADVKEKIRSALSQRMNAELKFESIHASFFPPHVRVSDLDLSGGHEDISGTVSGLEVDFKILPLFKGRLRSDSIVITDPKLTIPFPESVREIEKPKGVSEYRTLHQVREQMIQVLSRMQAILHDASIAVKNGSVLCTRKGETLFGFQNLDAKIDLPPDKLELDLASTSNLWESVTFTGKINTDGSNAGGELRITGLQLQPIINYFTSNMANDFKSARVTLELDFKSRDLDTIKGNLEGSAVYDMIPYPAEIAKTTFVYSDENLVLNDFNIRIGKSHFGASSSGLDLKGKKNLKIKSGAADWYLDDTLSWAAPLISKINGLKDIALNAKNLKGVLSFSAFDLQGPLMQPGEWKFTGKGTAENLVLQNQELPAPLKLEHGEFEGDRERMTFTLRKLTLQGSSMWVHGTLESLSSLDIKFNGTISEKIAGLLKDREIIPNWLNITAPVSLSDAHLIWKPQSQTVFFEADLEMENAPRLVLSLLKDPNKLTVKNLSINDSVSQASMSMSLGDDIIDIDFKGTLADGTLEKFIQGRQNLSGWIRGNFGLHIETRHPGESRIQGRARAGGWTYGKGLHTPVRVQELIIQGEGDKIRIDSADLIWGDTHIHANGNVGMSPKGIVLDLVASTQGIVWEEVKRMVQAEAEIQPPKSQKKSESYEQGNAFGDLYLEGKMVLESDYFKYDELIWKPFHLVMNFQKKSLEVQLTRGNLCGIQMEATAGVLTEPFWIEGKFEARDKPLGFALDCLLKNKLMTGKFDFTGEIAARGNAENFMENSQGRFIFTARDGLFLNKYGLLARILAVVNITEILKGQAPDFTGDGFPYKLAQASGVIKDGVVTLNESYIDGKSVDLAFTGSLDIPEKQIDLTVLVTPLKTVDTIIQKIPLVGYVLGENFIAIPVRVKGDLSKPSVTPMSPSSVGKGVLGILERTLKLPLKVIQPFLPEEETQSEK